MANGRILRKRLLWPILFRNTRYKRMKREQRHQEAGAHHDSKTQ
jgi:hypothetical protein